MIAWLYMVDSIRLGKAIGQLILVALPTLFVLLWTLDAALVPGADVFIIAVIQLLFIVVYIGYNYRKSPTA